MTPVQIENDATDDLVFPCVVFVDGKKAFRLDNKPGFPSGERKKHMQRLTDGLVNLSMHAYQAKRNLKPLHLDFLGGDLPVYDNPDVGVIASGLTISHKELNV